MIKALDVVGASDVLAAYLAVPSRTVINWMLGKEECPPEALVRLSRLPTMDARELAAVIASARIHLQPPTIRRNS